MNLLKNKSINSQKGLSMIIVLILLSITMLLGISAVNISLMGERTARNDRDYQIAWQSAESGLQDAELDIDIDNKGTSSRILNTSIFDPKDIINFPASGCIGQGNYKGICALEGSDAGPLWFTIDLTSESSPAVVFGSFTNRTFSSGEGGLKPRKSPRYIIEALLDTAPGLDASASQEKYLYRITSLGFGPRDDIHAVTQSIFRK